MVQLQSKITDSETAGVQLVGISYDSTEILKKFSSKQKLSFPLLSDPGSNVINAFHIGNKNAPEKLQGIPHPGTFIIDQKGTIRSKLFLESYRKRHPASEVLNAAKAAKS